MITNFDMFKENNEYKYPVFDFKYRDGLDWLRMFSPSNFVIPLTEASPDMLRTGQSVLDMHNLRSSGVILKYEEKTSPYNQPRVQIRWEEGGNEMWVNVSDGKWIGIITDHYIRVKAMRNELRKRFDNLQDVKTKGPGMINELDPGLLDELGISKFISDR